MSRNRHESDASPWTANFTMAIARTGKGRFHVALAANSGASLAVSLNGTSIGSLAPKQYE